MTTSLGAICGPSQWAMTRPCHRPGHRTFVSGSHVGRRAQVDQSSIHASPGEQNPWFSTQPGQGTWAIAAPVPCSGWASIDLGIPSSALGKISSLSNCLCLGCESTLFIRVAVNMFLSQPSGVGGCLIKAHISAPGTGAQASRYGVPSGDGSKPLQLAYVKSPRDRGVARRLTLVPGRASLPWG